MHTNNIRTALIIPTLNAERDNWTQILGLINQQTYQPDHKLILDSGSKDNTINTAKVYGFEIHHVKPGTFDHAGTRKWGIELIKDRADIVIFMTQDALLTSNNSFMHLLESFNDEMIAVTYGRQLPRDNSNAIEAFGRLFNYPEQSETRVLEDKNRLGMKVAFCSDSYAAYKIETIKRYDAFPDRSIVGEDYITAGRMLLKGYKIRYEANATVKHSHDYTIIQEFKRYFDIGVFHQEYQDLIRALGTSEKAGAGFVISELKYLLERKPTHIPLSILRTAFKYMGYKIGKAHSKINATIKRTLSMHNYYF